MSCLLVGDRVWQSDHWSIKYKQPHSTGSQKPITRWWSTSLAQCQVFNFYSPLKEADKVCYMDIEMKNRKESGPTLREFHLVCCIRQPIVRSLSTTDDIWLGITGLMEMVDRVIDAAIRKVPASIRSGIIWYWVPWSFFFPVICRVLVPAPSILAPHDIKKFARSTTSGSCTTD